MKLEYSTILKNTARIICGCLLFVLAAQHASKSSQAAYLATETVQAAQPATISLSKVAQIIHDKVNSVRLQNGLKPLDYNADLQTIAQARSNDMAANNYFSHVNQKGQRPSDVAKEMGYNFKNNIGNGKYLVGIGENIYKRTGGVSLTEEQIAEAAFKGWMNSPGHKANILHGHYKAEGIAYAIKGNSIYVTQNFA